MSALLPTTLFPLPKTLPSSLTFINTNTVKLSTLNNENSANPIKVIGNATQTRHANTNDAYKQGNIKNKMKRNGNIGSLEYYPPMDKNLWLSYFCAFSRLKPWRDL